MHDGVVLSVVLELLVLFFQEKSTEENYSFTNFKVVTFLFAQFLHNNLMYFFLTKKVPKNHERKDIQPFPFIRPD